MPNILLVEDDPEHRRLIPLLLKTLPYPIVGVKNAARALEFLEKETPPLILLDIAMPGMNGLELLRIIRENPRLAATKVIIVTAVANKIPPADIAGVDRVIKKPFQARDLETAILEVMSTPTQE
jgi:CheY-like chemotaxis protein